MHSLLMSSLVGSEDKVIAFEPGKESSEELRANINRFNNFRNIKTKKTILGENSGRKFFSLFLHMIQEHLMVLRNPIMKI